MEVAGLDHVEVDDAEGADAGGGEIHGEGRAEAAGTDAEHARVFQLELAGLADFGKDEVAGVAGHFIRGKRCCGGGAGGGLCCRCRFSRDGRAAGDRRDDGERVGFFYRRIFLVVEVADVFVVEIDVDEGAQSSFIRVEMFAQLGELRGKGGERFGDGFRGDVDDGLTAGEGAEWSGDVNLHDAFL